jgi:hypothetical protein
MQERGVVDGWNLGAKVRRPLAADLSASPNTKHFDLAFHVYCCHYR